MSRPEEQHHLPMGAARDQTHRAARPAPWSAPGKHAPLLLHQAGWHLSASVAAPGNITPLPPKCPELNAMKNIWQLMRDNCLSNRIFLNHDDIVEHCCRS
jgi:hypothetical protein